MNSKKFIYALKIKEGHLDFFEHVNNAVYLQLFEEARWDFLNRSDYGLAKIKQTGIAPTVLAVNMRFLRELRLYDEIIIESQIIGYEGKIGKMNQKMLRNDELCCDLELTLGLFSLKERKLVSPTQEWLAAVGQL